MFIKDILVNLLLSWSVDVHPRGLIAFPPTVSFDAGIGPPKEGKVGGSTMLEVIPCVSAQAGTGADGG